MSKFSNLQNLIMRHLELEHVGAYKASKLMGNRADYTVRVSVINAKHQLFDQRAYIVQQIDLTISDARPNRILKMQDQKYQLIDVSPNTKNAHVGVEIECLIPVKSLNISPKDSMCDCGACDGRGSLIFINRETDQTIEADCQNCDGTGQVERDDDEDQEYDFDEVSDAIESLNINKYKVKKLAVHDDGSLRPENGYVGVEFVLLMPEDDFSQLEKLCNMLEDLRAVVNASCGLHVHLDQRNSNPQRVRRLGARFKKALPFLCKMVPKSRVENNYCKPDVSKLKGDNRYFAVNLTSYLKHSTIEIRLHSGSTNFLKIKNWINILTIIKQKPIPSSVNNWSAFKKYINNEDLANYMDYRKSLFNKSSIEFDSFNEQLAA